MNLAPLFLVAGLCLAFTLLLFFVREQVTLRSLPAKRSLAGGRTETTGGR